MSVQDVAAWLQATQLSQTIAESGWIFPTIECVHVLSVVLVVGLIAIVDLRLIGFASRQRDVDELIAQFVPATLVAFVGALASGLLLFMGKPTTYVANGFFLIKMALILLAGVNMAVFHGLSHRRRAASGSLATGSAAASPTSARVAGFASLAFWAAVIVCGRWIGFSVQ